MAPKDKNWQVISKYAFTIVYLFSWLFSLAFVKIYSFRALVE